MVNRINDNHYSDYSVTRTVNNIQETGEKFSLDYRQGELQPEETPKGDKEPLDRKGKTGTAERNGVRLELSQSGLRNGGKREQEKTVNNGQTRTAGAFLWDTVQKFFTVCTDLIQTVKELFHRIWNEPEPEDTAQSSDAAAVRGENQVIRLLTDNGQRRAARNSNLLTYYDRSGRLTQINPSDRERILHGDRSSRKL